MPAAWLSFAFREGLQCACSARLGVTKAPGFRPLLRLHTSTRQFTTSPASRAGIAAPEVDFNSFVPSSQQQRQNGKDGDRGEERGGDDLFYARLVPESASYFTAKPTFTDDFLRLEALVRRYAHLPVLSPVDSPRVVWRSRPDYEESLHERISSSKYFKIVQVLDRLNQIHPSVMPDKVKSVLNEYKRDVNPFQNTARTIPVDKYGRALGAGRRKSSTARAYVVEGTGEVLVNGKTLAEKFSRIHDRESAIWALKCTDRIDKYNVWALVGGGGTTGQAEAITLAVAKALLAHEPDLKPSLRRAGCVTRDPRRVERKKPGHVKARKMPAWVKR